MNWKKIIGIIAGIALLAIIVIKLKTNKEIATDRVFYYDKEQAIHVQTQTIKEDIIDNPLSFTGNFEANKETKLSAETQGKVNYVSVDVGDFVSKGQALIQLDKTLLELQLQTILVQIEGLELDINRYTILAKADAIQGVQLEKALLGLKTAKIQKETIIEQIKRTAVKAPFSGVVTMKHTEIGGFAAPGVPLLQITDINTLKFTINVSETELNQFDKSNTYEVTADAYPQNVLSGKISLVGSKANMGGSYPVQFTVKNLNKLEIKAGMFGKVVLTNSANEKGIVIPTAAIIGNTNQPQVYLVKDGKAILQSIEISQRLQNEAVISYGINLGDILITSGLVNLFDGANVIFNQN
jgi:RND family efflux transporter MFP subunit